MLFDICGVFGVYLEHQIRKFYLGDIFLYVKVVLMRSQFMNLMMQVVSIHILDCVNNGDCVVGDINAIFLLLVHKVIGEKSVSANDLSVDDSASNISIFIFKHLNVFFSISKSRKIFIH